MNKTIKRHVMRVSVINESVKHYKNATVKNNVFKFRTAQIIMPGDLFFQTGVEIFFYWKN